MNFILRPVPLCLFLLFFQCSENNGSERAKSPESRTGISVDSAYAPETPDTSVPTKPVDEMSRDERDLYKQKRVQGGFYNCCIKPTCNMCLYEEAEECPCATLLKKGDAVCGECYKGWQKGKGALKGVNPKDVRRM